MLRSMSNTTLGVVLLAAAVSFSGAGMPVAAETTASSTPTVTPDFEASDVAPPKPKPKPKPKANPNPKPADTTPPKPKPKPKPKAPPPPPIVVDLELVMLIDVSASVDDEEFALQRLGYVDAFNDPELHELVESRDGIAVNMIQWSGAKQQRGSGWMILRTADDCVRFAKRVARFERRYAQDTVLSRALDVALRSLTNNKRGRAKIEGRRLLIDVSGDGVCENQYFYATGLGGRYSDGTPMDAKYYGRPWDQVQQRLLRHEVTVNGVSIGNTPGLQQWYAQHVARGEFGFAMHAEGFDTFGQAIKRKLLRELATPVPETTIETLYD